VCGLAQLPASASSRWWPSLRDRPRRTALGTYNFSGDLGKVAVPAAVRSPALARLAGAVESTASSGWWPPRHPGALGRLGAGSAAGVAARRRRGARQRLGIRDVRAFTAISAIHVIDNSTRTASSPSCPSC